MRAETEATTARKPKMGVLNIEKGRSRGVATKGEEKEGSSGGRGLKMVEKKKGQSNPADI